MTRDKCQAGCPRGPVQNRSCMGAADTSTGAGGRREGRWSLFIANPENYIQKQQHTVKQREAQLVRLRSACSKIAGQTLEPIFKAANTRK